MITGCGKPVSAGISGREGLLGPSLGFALRARFLLNGLVAEREGWTRAIHGARASRVFASLIRPNSLPANLSNPNAACGCSVLHIPTVPTGNKKTPRKAGFFYCLAEREGFEPSKGLLNPYSLSRGAPSATRPPLRDGVFYTFLTEC